MSLIEVVLISSLAFFVLCQIFNAIVNLCTARYMRKKAILQAKIREEEARATYEQGENILIKFGQVIEMFQDLDASGHIQIQILEQMAEKIMDRDGKEKPRVIRGKYKPRKPKAIEHKESQ